MSAEPSTTDVGGSTPCKQSGCCGGRGSLLKKIGLGLVLVVGALAIVVARQPTDFTVERSATIAAPADVVFGEVNDLHNWEAWSPWLEADPNSKTTYEGASSGVGAVFKWSGNSDVGEGIMTITESRPNELIRIKLEFVRPFAGESTSEFVFKPAGDQTEVAWNMFGEKDFMAKAIHMVIDMDAMIGGQFEKGLSKLKTVAEGKAEQKAEQKAE